ncbi:glycosyltransferase family 4 protein [Cerasicoccus fimbriatus]|uniref:glycosyltransferase family 4 protein n=1 Tax=Cerasicoccus fimbriatus TaxID=3014554 RepID=UPI0022B41827|nr:glycosyltransferase family 4 protein [Cerasicoccus sp. TK19100]
MSNQKSTTCVIGFDDDKVIKDFIRIHIENLTGEIICLHKYPPYYEYKGRQIQHFYSRNKFALKAKRLLPQFLYHRLVTQKLESDDAITDALGGLFDEHGVDLILAEFGNIGASIAPYAKRLGIPLVVHFHGHDAHRQPYLTKEMRAQYEVMFDYASGILGVSKYMMREIEQLGCSPTKLTYNPYGPRDSFYTLSPSYEPTLLSVGRFTNIKANYLNILAFERALKEVPNAKMIMIGDGELLETCKTMAKVLKVDDKITFTGSIPHAEIQQHFTRACGFAQHSVIPSYGDAEGTPNTILEAGAAALPVVSTRHAGIKDVVIEGETGFLVDELDVDGMAQGMVRLLKDSELARRMGTNAREHIRSNYNTQQHVQRLQEVLDAARNTSR